MTEITEVPSPFCGIGTDDLTISVDGLSLKVLSNGCAVNTPAFEQVITDFKPRVAGKQVALEHAVAKAVEILQDSNQPIIGGCATDVNGMRALLALADRCGAVVDQMNFNASRRNYLAMQDSGWMTTTLAEVKNRCDLLLVVGKDLESFVPRFFERYFWNQESMFLEDTANREVIYLGKAPSGTAQVSPNGKQAQVLTCADTDLPEVVTVLRALVKGHKIVIDSVGGIKVSDLQTVAERLQAAKYGVVTWAASSLVFDQAELTVQSICELIKDINDQGSRCSGLPLSGKEGDLTANQVAGWISGYPARISYAKGYPEYDPYLYDSRVMIENGEGDALLWVQAFNSKAIPPVTDVPTIVLGRSGMLFDKEPDVYIPLGTPGIDHAGHAYRADSVVAIRLKKLRDSGLPAAADVLSAIERGLLI
ncbi:formylmethanofuran dehydrogenase subunit B [Methylotuvimicrobium buryatense]|uniref:Formylmethanofuran dehydrogenase subunit B n=1 Tax=Methylotuvimicrobium buryatense TaxID=95641 RepID=A0A4P9UPB2_METBY|nr:formylmethanofuran dehydrogenase subunit B [Methylotuvimicrobium buryatense]QCW82350.1 formylmethanofuran dehydrogenase subunit B [Methylotuvimicrobium buryatense]